MKEKSYDDEFSVENLKLVRSELLKLLPRLQKNGDYDNSFDTILDKLTSLLKKVTIENHPLDHYMSEEVYYFLFSNVIKIALFHIEKQYVNKLNSNSIEARSNFLFELVVIASQNVATYNSMFFENLEVFQFALRLIGETKISPKMINSNAFKKERLIERSQFYNNLYKRPDAKIPSVGKIIYLHNPEIYFRTLQQAKVVKTVEETDRFEVKLKNTKFVLFKNSIEWSESLDYFTPLASNFNLKPYTIMEYICSEGDLGVRKMHIINKSENGEHYLTQVGIFPEKIRQSFKAIRNGEAFKDREKRHMLIKVRKNTENVSYTLFQKEDFVYGFYISSEYLQKPTFYSNKYNITSAHYDFFKGHILNEISMSSIPYKNPMLDQTHFVVLKTPNITMPIYSNLYVFITKHLEPFVTRVEKLGNNQLSNFKEFLLLISLLDIISIGAHQELMKMIILRIKGVVLTNLKLVEVSIHVGITTSLYCWEILNRYCWVLKDEGFTKEVYNHFNELKAMDVDDSWKVYKQI